MMEQNRFRTTIARTAMMLVLMLLTTAQTAWADGDFVDNGDGTYTIGTADG